jgi:hypothetical protein
MAGHDADGRVGGQHDQGDVAQEERVERRADEVERVGGEHEVERARPEQEGNERAAARQPHRAEEDRQPHDEIGRVLADEH